MQEQKLHIKNNSILLQTSVFGNIFNAEVKIKDNIIFENASYSKAPDEVVINFVKEKLVDILDFSILRNDLYVGKSAGNENYIYTESSRQPHEFTIMFNEVLYKFEIKILNTGVIYVKDLCCEDSCINYIISKLDKINNSYNDKDYKEVLINLINKKLK